MANQRILVEREDGVGIITLNRPETLDVINRKLGAELLDAVKVLEADDATGCLAITGAGEKTLVAASRSRWKTTSATHAKSRIALAIPGVPRELRLCQAGHRHDQRPLLRRRRSARLRTRHPGRVRELHRHCPRQIMMTSDLSWIGEHHHGESGYRQLTATS